MNVPTIGRNGLRTTSFNSCCTAWACIMGDQPTKGYWFHTEERQSRGVSFLQIIRSCRSKVVWLSHGGMRV
jgi:hypothetical protein